MKKLPSQNKHKNYGGIIYFAIIALIIQIAILTFDYISSKTDSKLIIALSMLCIIIFFAVTLTIYDAIHKKITVKSSVEKILEATQKISTGDFSVRLNISHQYGKYNDFDLIFENINILAEELEKTDRLQSDFISNVSHELKTPVSVILGYCELLKDEKIDEETREKYIQVIVETSRRLNTLITNVLQLSKLENQKIRPEFSPFSLDGSLSECVLAFEDLIESKNLTLVCDFEQIRINSSKSLLEIVWNNLISNAIKFTDLGSIKISLKNEKNFAKVTITDSGCGISENSGGRIFDKFYQEETSHSREGNGLGLAMVKKVIEILGGQITVESEINLGTTFTVLLSGVIND